MFTKATYYANSQCLKQCHKKSIVQGFILFLFQGNELSRIDHVFSCYSLRKHSRYTLATLINGSHQNTTAKLRSEMLKFKDQGPKCTTPVLTIYHSLLLCNTMQLITNECYISTKKHRVDFNEGFRSGMKYHHMPM